MNYNMFVDRKYFSIMFILPNQGAYHFYHMLTTVWLMEKETLRILHLVLS